MTEVPSCLSATGVETRRHRSWRAVTTNPATGLQNTAHSANHPQPFKKKKKTLAYESFNSRNKKGKPGLHDVS